MHTLGPIIRLQIQRSALKVGDKPNRTYITDPLLTAERLRVDPDGIVAHHLGTDVLDVHHRHHPQTRNEDGLNGLSIGFTSHYRTMQERFGPHMTVGCAGENLIVDTDRMVTLDEIASGIAVMDPAGRVKLTIDNVRVARPCRPFSGFAWQGAPLEPEVMKETLQFLDGGTRGFYGIASGVADLAVGDVLAVG